MKSSPSRRVWQVAFVLRNYKRTFVPKYTTSIVPDIGSALGIDFSGALVSLPRSSLKFGSH